MSRFPWVLGIEGKLRKNRFTSSENWFRHGANDEVAIERTTNRVQGMAFYTQFFRVKLSKRGKGVRCSPNPFNTQRR